MPVPRRPPTPAASPRVATAAWARSFFSHPSAVSAFLWAAGVLTVLVVLATHHWSGAPLVVLIVTVSVATVAGCIRATVGPRLPHWTLKVDPGLGNLLISVGTAAAASEHVNLANLYLLVEVFTLLYLSMRVALIYLAGSAAAYAVVLGFWPHPGQVAFLAWLMVFGTGVVLGVVIVGLVSVLNSTARQDPLTGLANRRSWDERLEAELSRSARTGEPLSVVVVDLDDFKAINDASGHHAGDRVLEAVGRSWLGVTRGDGDLLARLGGDEFGLLSPGSDELGARRLARRLTEALPDGLAASVGMATWNGIENASDLVRRADRAMYDVKRSHRRRRDDRISSR